MTINASGLVLWSAPVAGTYTVTANATDSVTGLTGSAIASITVAQPVVAPIVSNATVAGQAGKVFSYTIPPQSTVPQSFSLVGVVPAGMTISPSGTLSWTNPLAGTYPITVKATDTTTLATGTGVITVQIAKATVTATGPVISASALTGTAGKFLTGTIGISASGERSIRINIRGNPSGMRFSVSGQSIILRWARPVRGSYTLLITATDSKGLSAQATMPITIN